MDLREALKQVKVARGFMDEDTIPSIALDKAIALLEQPFMLGDLSATGQAIYGCIDGDDCKHYNMPVSKIKKFANKISARIDGDVIADAAQDMGYDPDPDYGDPDEDDED